MDNRDETMGQWNTIRDDGGASWQAAPGETFGDLPTLRDEGVVLAGRYKVVKRLGEGGMGSVWLAEDAKLDNRKVAVKMLPAILAGKKGAYRQVKAEAMMAMKLSHPNIATVRSFEEDEGGNPFLVMDYIEGEPLDDILAERGPLGEEETVKLLGPVAAALDYAHSQGVVHRDVKPGNVMVRKDGTPFVLDFGIAREVQETMTMVTGKLSSGTLLYMSPEQLKGRAPKAAQDVYSFAAMAYECLAGRPPFSRGQIEWQIVNESPEELPGSVGEALRKGVMAGLAKEAGERPGTCEGVLNGKMACGKQKLGDDERAQLTETKGTIREASGSGRIDGNVVLRESVRCRKNAEESQDNHLILKLQHELEGKVEKAEAHTRSKAKTSRWLWLWIVIPFLLGVALFLQHDRSPNEFFDVPVEFPSGDASNLSGQVDEFRNQRDTSQTLVKIPDSSANPDHESPDIPHPDLSSAIPDTPVGNPVPQSNSPVASGNVDKLLVSAQSLLSQGDYAQARETALQALDAASADPAVEQFLSDLAIPLLVSPRPMSEKVPYTVRSGDMLSKIAGRFSIPVELIRRANNLSGDMIHVGQTLLLLDGKNHPFAVAVSKSRNDLLVTLGGKFFKRYRVATGVNGKTPAGTFTIVDKIEHPTWHPANRPPVPYGSTENLLGTHWLALDRPGYGIHGTWQPETVGHSNTDGCLVLCNEDVEELYNILPRGTRIEISE